MSWKHLSRLGLERAKKSVLIEAYIDLTGQSGSDSYGYPGTKAGLLKEINRLLDEDLERLFRNRGSQPIRADLCDIPAAEVDAWLQTLPAVEPV